MRLLIFVLLLTTSLWAQHSEQPSQESSADIRGQTTLFSIEVVSDKKIFILERTPNMDYFLRMKAGKEEVIRKISSSEAKKVDMDFASRFLRCQYELPKSIEKNCSVTLRLKMKGEEQEICKKEDKKSQEIGAFVAQLHKRF